MTMRHNHSYPGLTRLMRKGDFVSCESEWEPAGQLSELSVCNSTRKSLSVVKHVRNFDHSGLRVERKEFEFRVHGLAQPMRNPRFCTPSCRGTADSESALCSRQSQSHRAS